MLKISKINKPKWLFFLIIVPFIIYWSFSLLLGYFLFGPSLCSKWHAGMSPNEKIELALKFVNDSSTPSFKFQNSEGGISRSPTKQVPYDDIYQILKEQPNCCKLYSQTTAHSENPSENLPPNDEGVVYLEYKAQYKEFNGDVLWGTISTYLDYNQCPN